MKCEEVLNEVQESYSSCEVRTAALKIQDTWYNLLTCIRLSEHAPGEQQAMVGAKWSQLISPNNQLFQFAFTVVDWKNSDAIFSMFKGGLLNLGTLQVSLGWYPDVPQLLGRVTESGDSSSIFPSFEAIQGIPPGQMDATIVNQLRFVESNERLTRHLSSRGYSSVHDVLQQFMGLGRDARPECDSRIMLWLPIFGRIQQAELADKKLIVTYTAHPKLTSQFFVHAKLLNGYYHEIKRFSLSSSRDSSHTSPWTQTASADLPPMADDHCVDVSLLHQNLGHVTLRRFHKKDLLPPEIFDPFWTLLQRFCSATELSELLTQPGAIPDDPKLGKCQRQFEVHVSWLLASFGFRTAWLGRHEKLKVAGREVELGSLDLLAFNDARGMLVLGSCTMNPPNDSDYNNLVNLRSQLLGDARPFSTFTAHLIVFTAAVSSHRSRQLDEHGYDQISILDGQSLRDAVDALERLDHNWLFERLSRIIWPLQ